MNLTTVLNLNSSNIGTNSGLFTPAFLEELLKFSIDSKSMLPGWHV